MLAFFLSMPSNNAWNGKWTGEGKPYVMVRANPTKNAPVKLSDIKDYYSYAFGDGWVAAIQVKQVDGNKAKKLRRKSAGFYGYNWMVDSILKKNKIVVED
jgi:hypothetical protein